MILKKIMFITFFIIGMAALAGANQTIIIDPIGDHISGEKFNITGTSTLLTCKQIGMEIFPKKYWESIAEYAKSGNAGRIVFKEIAPSKANLHPTGIKLVRSNPDGTQSYEPMTTPQDHVNSVSPLEKNSAGAKRWSIQIEKDENGRPLSPGSYHVNVWDASTQVQHPGVSLGNGWDIINKKIYPSTARSNLWDIKNQKDMEYAEFTIRGA